MLDLLEKVVNSHREIEHIKLLMSIEESRFAVLGRMLAEAVVEHGDDFPLDICVDGIQYVVDVAKDKVVTSYKHDIESDGGEKRTSHEES